MLTVILKCTDGCNLDCAYCSLGEKPCHHVIPAELLQKTLEYICRVCERRGEDKAEIILHGGEPTLVPRETYAEAFDRAQGQGVDFRLSMQTNAYKLTPEYIRFFKDYDVHVGVSIDGSAAVHDKERRSQNGKETFAVVAEHIDQLLRENINVSCLMVLTAIGAAAPVDFLDFYAIRGLHLKINPLLNYGMAAQNPALALRQGDYARYLIRVYEYVTGHDIDVMISPLDVILRAFVYEQPISECTFRADCNKRFLCVDHMGDIYPCGKYSDVHQFRLGNVCESGPDLLDTPQMKTLLERRSCAMPEQCRSCSFRNICHAGCSAEAAIENRLGQPPVLCEDYKILFRYFSGDGLRILRRKLAERRQYLMEMLDGI